MQTSVLQLCRTTTCQDGFQNPNLSILHKYLQYIRLRFILFLRVLRLHAGIDLRGQVDRASSKVNNVSELVQRLLRRKRRRTVVVGSRESPPPKSIVIVLIERLGQNKDIQVLQPLSLSVTLPSYKSLSSPLSSPLASLNSLALAQLHRA